MQVRLRTRHSKRSADAMVLIAHACGIYSADAMVLQHADKTVQSSIDKYSMLNDNIIITSYSKCSFCGAYINVATHTCAFYVNNSYNTVKIF
jgi:hypothetical protein